MLNLVADLCTFRITMGGTKSNSLTKVSSPKNRIQLSLSGTNLRRWFFKNDFRNKSCIYWKTILLHSSGQASNAMKEVDNALSKWLHFPQVKISPLKSWWRNWNMQLWSFEEMLVVTISKKKTWDYNFWEKFRETLKTYKIWKTFVLWTITLRFPANNSRRIVTTKNFILRL